MSKIWSFDVEIAATAYVRAGTAEEAKAKFAIFEQSELEHEMIFGGAYFDAPEVSFSPAMTVQHPYPGEPDLAWDSEDPENQP